MTKVGTYVARKGAPFRNEHVGAIGRFIENISEKSTENILQEIKSHPNHIIHSYIEWDDTIASQKYRIQQVRNIVNHIEIVVKQKYSEEPVRVYLSVKPTEDSAPRYMNIKAIFSDQYLRDQVIQRALAELKHWKERYHVYKELTDIVDALTPYLNDLEIKPTL